MKGMLFLGNNGMSGISVFCMLFLCLQVAVQDIAGNFMVI